MMTCSAMHGAQEGIELQCDSEILCKELSNPEAWQVSPFSTAVCKKYRSVLL